MSNSATLEKPSESIVAAKEMTPTAQVAQSIRRLLDNGTIHLPPDYSVENALKSAWLYLQTVQDINKQAALTVCTRESVVNALLAMVYQGLNVDKKQGYFIVYGKALTWQRSYFGDIALAIRLSKNPIEIYSEVVYKGDTFEYESIRGRTVVVKHSKKLENQKPENIVAAYCGVYQTETGEDLGAEIMTLEQIKKSWGMSKTYKSEGNSPHNNFPDQMALRTVIRRRTKHIINTSSDELLMAAIRQQEHIEMTASMDAELAEHANGEMLSIPASVSELAPVQTAQAEPVPVATGQIEAEF